MPANFHNRVDVVEKQRLQFHFQSMSHIKIITCTNLIIIIKYCKWGSFSDLRKANLVESWMTHLMTEQV